MLFHPLPLLTSAATLYSNGVLPYANVAQHLQYNEASHSLYRKWEAFHVRALLRKTLPIQIPSTPKGPLLRVLEA